MDDKQELLQIKDLSIGYQSGRRTTKTIAGPLNLTLKRGQLVCLLGPNGCGKSTLIRTIAGLQAPHSGNIILESEDLLKMKPRELATRLSLVLTDKVRSGNLDVFSVVSLGRYPYSGWLGRLSNADEEIVAQAMEVTGTASFASRKMDSLSDGEAQKVMLARAIAQDTPVIILDEPTAHLDLPSRIQLMRLLHQLAAEMNKTILISTHELDLALQVADQLWLMTSDGKLTSGMPEELILDGSFQAAFEREGISFDAETGNFNLHQPGAKLAYVQGAGTEALWTRKALVRTGYTIIELPKPTALSIQLYMDQQQMTWIVEASNHQFIYTSLSDLIASL